MSTKAEQTRQHIIETVAPLFNRYGYAATSMADITKAVGMTKGAVYGNFENKEALAVAAFNHNIRRFSKTLVTAMDHHQDPLKRVYAMLDYFADYGNHIEFSGGCPIVNVGIDANNNNEALLQRVQDVIHKLQQGIANELQACVDKGMLTSTLPIPATAQYIYTSIQGAIFMTMTMQNDQYLAPTTQFLKQYLKPYEQGSI